jgi:hypothetical protein
MSAELQGQLHDDLRAQHPDWIDTNGNNPMLDWYARPADFMPLSVRVESSRGGSRFRQLRCG